MHDAPSTQNMMVKEKNIKEDKQDENSTDIKLRQVKETNIPNSFIYIG